MPLVKNFDKGAIVNAIQMDDEFGKFAAKTLRSLVEPYVPYNTGRLCNDVTIRPFAFEYNAPYANKVYNDLHRNFRKDKHPLATANWVEVAMPTVENYFVHDLQSYIGGKRFDV